MPEPWFFVFFGVSSLASPNWTKGFDVVVVYDQVCNTVVCLTVIWSHRGSYALTHTLYCLQWKNERKNRIGTTIPVVLFVLEYSICCLDSRKALQIEVLYLYKCVRKAYNRAYSATGGPDRIRCCLSGSEKLAGFCISIVMIHSENVAFFKRQPSLYLDSLCRLSWFWLLSFCQGQI